VTLPASFYDRPVLEVAPDLLGCVLSYRDCAGVIVETEAYHESEPACHAFVGRTPRTETLFAAPGTTYIYRSYGIHALINAVCEPEGAACAVLIRALEPLEGLDLMRERRGLSDPEQLCSGPGKLTQAMGIGLDLNATNFVAGPIVISGREHAPGQIIGERIGITRAMELPWRFCVAGNRHVSRPRPRGFVADPR
jgi:DNA-3-methyladenine glycosylase